MTSEEYAVKHGRYCPVCFNQRLETGDMVLHIDSTQNSVTLDIYCPECGSSWTDVYHLVGYRSLDREDEDDL